MSPSSVLLDRRVEIEAQLEKVVASDAFGGASTNWSRLFRYVVEKALADEAESLFERLIGEEALGRRAGYDTQADRIVSVTKNRLVKEKLPAYYAGDGRSDRIRFHMPPRGFLVEIEVVPEELPLEMLLDYHRALHSYDGRSAEGMLEAMSRLERLTAAAPGHGASWALLAEISLVVANLFGDPRVLMPKSRDAAAKALAIDCRLWRAHLSAAGCYGSMDRDWERASEHAAMALRIGGSHVACNHLYAAVLVGLGRREEAIRQFETALFGETELARVRVLRADLALMTWVAGDLERTRVIVADLLAENPDNYLYRANEAILLVAEGRYAEAAAAFERSVELLGHPFLPGWHAFAIGKAGDPRRAREIAERWTATRESGGFIHASQLAAAWLGAGEPEVAIRMIEQGLNDGEPFMMWTGLTPFHRELHGHPRFEAILAAGRFARS
jgi:tetratricopeptide (TPR) repeat protein